METKEVEAETELWGFSKEDVIEILTACAEKQGYQVKNIHFNTNWKYNYNGWVMDPTVQTFFEGVTLEVERKI